MLILFVLTLIVSVSYAFAKGAAPEKLCASVFVGMAILQYPGRFFIDRVFTSVDGLSLAVDCVGFAGLTALALVANRNWTLCTAALQLLSCGSHFGREILVNVQPLAYALLKTAPTYVAFLILIAGTYLESARRSRGKFIPNWVESFEPPRWIPAFLTR